MAPPAWLGNMAQFGSSAVITAKKSCRKMKRFRTAIEILKAIIYLSNIFSPVFSLKMKNLILLFLILPSIAFAGWINKAGESIPDSDDRKSVNYFGAQLIFVGNENELFKRWSIPSETVDIDKVDKVRVNDAINAFVIFSGCTQDKCGNCSVSMRFRVLQPDGKIYADTPPMEVWHEKPAPLGRTLELSVGYLKMKVEPQDQLGKYMVYAQVRDNNSETVLQLQAPFTAEKSE